MSGEQNEYEAERAKRIAENRAKMAQLGLVGASAALASTVGAPNAGFHGASFSDRGARSKPRTKRTYTKKNSAPVAPMRESKRLRGYTAPAPDLAAASALEEAAAVAAAAPDAGPLGTTTKGNPRKALIIPPNTAFTAPFSLRSIGTTVLELGEVHRGAWAQRYWSNRGCLFHHAYPVGYRAKKEVFGREYEMRIEAGPTGPIFSVKDVVSGRIFTGTSPTKPWTDVCIAHRTGQRISGPLFFGFSDPITQQAIASCLYSERELAAALAGETIEAEELTPEEAAAKEFAKVDGIGETTAMVLARTEALGGRRHSGVDSLKTWCQSSHDNAAVLLKFLLTSEEMPEATRRWPAWTERIAARVVAALTQKEEETFREERKDLPIAGAANEVSKAPKENVLENNAAAPEVGKVSSGVGPSPKKEKPLLRGSPLTKWDVFNETTNAV